MNNFIDWTARLYCVRYSLLFGAKNSEFRQCTLPLFGESGILADLPTITKAMPTLVISPDNRSQPK